MTSAMTSHARWRVNMTDLTTHGTASGVNEMTILRGVQPGHQTYFDAILSLKPSFLFLDI